MRDAHAIWKGSRAPLRFSSWMSRQVSICLVRLLDPADSARCSGPTTVDHVKEHPGGRRRDEARWLTALCWYHHIEHPPSKEIRKAQRQYLADAYGEAPLESGSGDQPEVAQDG
jgi:hypothetical protein